MIGNCYIVMWILIISLVLLGVIALIAGIIRNKRLQKKIEKGELDRMPEVKEVDVECCGQHEVCERDSLLAAVSKKIEYYDDEELDQFIGKAGDAYTEEETEMFRDVLYTTLDVEVAGWVRSLQLRGTPRRKRRGVWCFVSSAGLYCLFPGRKSPLGGVGALPGSKLPPGI